MRRRRKQCRYAARDIMIFKLGSGEKNDTKNCQKKNKTLSCHSTIDPTCMNSHSTRPPAGPKLTNIMFFYGEL